jgi:MFS family permease
VGAFAISAVMLRPFIGGIGDRRGRKLLMLGGAGLVAVSMMAYTLADSLWLLVVLRIFTGAGEAAFYTGAASAINDLAPDARRGEALSYFSLALYSGLAVGPILGESVLEAIDFDTAWLVAGAFSAGAALLAVWLPDTRPEYEEEEGPALRRLLHPAGLRPGTILAASVWGLAGFSAFVPLYAKEIGLDGSRAVFFTYSAVVLGFRSLGARIPDILGPRKTASISLLSTTVGLCVVAAWAEPIGLFGGAIVFGFGQAMLFPAMMTIAINGARPSERGAVVGTFTAFFDLAFGLGSFSLGAIAHALGYRGLFFSAAAISLGGFFLLQGYARHPRSTGGAVTGVGVEAEGARYESGEDPGASGRPEIDARSVR